MYSYVNNTLDKKYLKVEERIVWCKNYKFITEKLRA